MCTLHSVQQGLSARLHIQRYQYLLPSNTRQNGTKHLLSLVFKKLRCANILPNLN